MLYGVLVAGYIAILRLDIPIATRFSVLNIATVVSYTHACM